MANELTISVSIHFKKTGAQTVKHSKTITSDVSGVNSLQHVQEIGTSEEAITLGDLAAGGYVYCENLDATNYIEIRQGTGIADLIRLDAGEFAVFRLTDDATAPYAIANTAACDMLVIGIDP